MGCRDAVLHAFHPEMLGLGVSITHAIPTVVAVIAAGRRPPGNGAAPSARGRPEAGALGARPASGASQSHEAGRLHGRPKANQPAAGRPGRPGGCRGGSCPAACQTMHNGLAGRMLTSSDSAYYTYDLCGHVPY